MIGLGHALSTFPNFLAYFVTGAALVAAFLAAYANLTPHREFLLIRAGNCAAAVALSGGLVGFVIPLASVIAHSLTLLEVLVWGIVALVVQLGGFLAARCVLPQLPQAIEAGNIAYAIFVAALCLALGILNAACLAG